MLENSSKRSFRLTLLFVTSFLLIISGVVFWRSESGAILESPEVSNKNLAAEWEQLGEDEASDSLFRSRMVESFHKLALACGTDENCLRKARSSLEDTFENVETTNLVLKDTANVNKAALYREIKDLDKEWSKDAARFSKEHSLKVHFSLLTWIHSIS